MILRMNVYSSLCAMEHFEINEIQADSIDFGSQMDTDPSSAEPYGCGDMRFERRESTPEVLAKYGFTQDDYDAICDNLESVLSFGHCGWCV